MKYFSISILALMIGAISFVSCEKQVENEELSKLPNIATPVKMLSNTVSVGQEHNIILTHFLNSNQDIVLLSYPERKDLISSWFSDDYSWDVDDLLSRFVPFEGGSPLYLMNYTPQAYLGSIEPQIDAYLYTRVEAVVNQTYLARSNEEDLHLLIDVFKSDALLDGGFGSNEDKLRFIDMLDVLDNSVALWYNMDYGSNNNFPIEFVEGISEDDYWKIAASDFLGGVYGGLTSGGTLALPGMAVASAHCVIGLW